MVDIRSEKERRYGVDKLPARDIERIAPPSRHRYVSPTLDFLLESRNQYSLEEKRVRTLSQIALF